MRALLVLLVLAGGAAAAVHVYLIPLNVLLVWRQPMRVSVATDPSGATLRLDGAPIGSTSPTAVSLPRDRADHLLEASKLGYEPARETIRSDRSVALAVRIHLEPAPAAAAPAPAPTPNGGASTHGTSSPRAPGAP